MSKILTTTMAAIVMIAGLAFSTSAIAQQEAEATKPKKTLTIGDKAPAINEISWIKGKGIDAFKPGDSYVVECWATWCGPCIRGIPHLTKLQKEYKGKIKIMGIAIWERGETTDEVMSKVKNFVAEQGDKMDYTVGLEKNSSIAKNWMGPAGQNGIPCAYLVDKDGRVAWIGHPGSIDPVLAKYTSGDWNTDEFAIEYRKQQEMEKVMESLYEKLYEARMSGDTDKALKLVDDALAKHPDLDNLKYMKFQIMLSSEDHARKAYEVGETLLRDNWDNSQMLNGISWSVLTDREVKYRDLNFALKAAERANNLTDGKDPAVLDTLAKAWFDKGEIGKAIECQERAVANAEEGPMKDDLKQTLETYVKAQPKVG